MDAAGAFADISTICDGRDPEGTGCWEMGIVEYDGWLAGPATLNEERFVPPAMDLTRVYPTPATRTVAIDYSLERPGHVSLKVIDCEGRHVAILLDRQMPCGPHRAHWNGRDDRGHSVPGGIYFLRGTADGKAVIRRTILIR
jgi:hypothetical protein